MYEGPRLTLDNKCEVVAYSRSIRVVGSDNLELPSVAERDGEIVPKNLSNYAHTA